MADREAKRDDMFKKAYGGPEHRVVPPVENNQPVSEIETKKLFFKYHKLQVTKAWEILSLQKSVETQRIPRGLRRLNFPNYELPDPRLLPEWLELQHKHAIDDLEFLIKFARSDKARFMELAEKTKAELQSLCTESELAKIIDDNEWKLDKVETDLSVKKAHKFERDKKDYLNNQVYTFASRFKPLRKQILEQKTTEEPQASDVSTFDSGSEKSDSDISNPDKGFLDELRVLQLDQKRRLNQGGGGNKADYEQGEGKGKGKKKWLKKKNYDTRWRRRQEEQQQKK